MTFAEAEAFLSDTPAQNRDAGDRLERMETQHEGRDDVLKAMEDGGGAGQTTGHKKEIPTEAASVNLLERPGEGAGRGSYNPARDGKLEQAAVPAITREIGDAIGRQSVSIRLLEGDEKRD